MARGEGSIADGWGDPSREKTEHSGSWLHVPARGSLRVVVLSTAPCRYRGHWIAGRMRLCAGQYCVYCEQRRGAQWRYAFAVLDAATRTSGLLEVGAGAAEAIYEASQAEGRLRGLCLALRKEQGRDRGRVLVTAEPAMMAAELLPEGEDPRPHLERQWAAEGPAGDRMEPVRQGVLRAGGG